MKTIRSLCFVPFAFSLLFVVGAELFAQTPAGQTDVSPKIQKRMSKFNCSVDRSGVAVCQRLAPAGKITGQEGVYTERSTKGKTCKWKCRVEQGVEVCRGSGSECNGKIPPHWQ